MHQILAAYGTYPSAFNNLDESATGFTLSIGAQPNRSPFETAVLTNFRAIYTNITNLTNQIKKTVQIAQIIRPFVDVVPRSPSLPLVATGHAPPVPISRGHVALTNGIGYLCVSKISAFPKNNYL
jgi:hypothetical protein